MLNRIHFLFLVSLLAACAEGDTNFTSVVTSDDLTVGDDATIAGDLVVTGTLTATGNVPAVGVLTGTNGGTVGNETNNAWAIAENSENLICTFGVNLATWSSSTGATVAFTPAVGFTGDATFSGGAGAITMSDSASSVVLPDNDTTALAIGSTDQLGLLTFDTGDATETVIVNGTTTVKAFDVAVGTSSFAETVAMVANATVGTTLGVTGDATLSGGAGALTFGAASSSVLVTDNSTTGLDIGSTGTTAGLRYDSTDNAENLVVNSAGIRAVGADITGTISLDASDCGKAFAVTAGIDTGTITLPDADAARGCYLTFSYVGADAGALLDISPLDSDADGIEGGLRAVNGDLTYFSGTADADIGLTKATSLTGDMIALHACGDAMWCVVTTIGIWANN
jgi:hypothetical protein